MASPGAGGENLDFEKADFGEAPSGARCGACGREVRITYFEVNGVTVCPSCRNGIAQLESPGGGAGRFARATLFGMLGGAGGAAVWYAVATLFNLEIGLIAILVGWLVGSGVRKGSGGRGGLKYQLLAAVLTYASIVTTYIPPIYSALEGQGETPAAITEGPSRGPGPGSGPAAPVPATPVSAGAEAPSASEAARPMGLGEALGALVLFAGILYGIAFAAPFLTGLENAVGILIIGFAVYQAWKMNARRVFEVRGPFRVAAGESPGSSPAPPASTG